MKEDKYLIINVEDLKTIVNAGRPENDKWNEPERLTRAGKDWIAWFLTEKIYNVTFEWRDRKKTEFPNIHKQIRASGKKGLVAVPCALIIKALKQKTKSTKTKQKQK